MSTNSEWLHPTPAELEVLQILWSKGSCTVREVYDEILNGREVTYTTALKTLQVMFEKGLVTREEVGKGHAYSASCKEDAVQRTLVSEFLDRTFGGAAQKLILQALTLKKASPTELAEIREMLDRLEEK